MSGPGAEDRAAWIAGMRKLLGILEANPGLPLPSIYGPGPVFRLLSGGPRELAETEQMFGVPFTGAPDPENDAYYVLSGDLDGLPLQIRAWASNVAERRVTGIRTVEDVEWVRLPTGDKAPEDETGGEDE